MMYFMSYNKTCKYLQSVVPTYWYLISGIEAKKLFLKNGVWNVSVTTYPGDKMPCTSAPGSDYNILTKWPTQKNSPIQSTSSKLNKIRKHLYVSFNCKQFYLNNYFPLIYLEDLLIRIILIQPNEIPYSW